MSWAFLVAGTPTTVVSQWKVDSASTSQLMVAFHRNLKTSSSSITHGNAPPTAHDHSGRPSRDGPRQGPPHGAHMICKSTGGTPVVKDKEIWVRTGNFKFAGTRKPDGANGVSSNGCVENTGFALAP